MAYEAVDNLNVYSWWKSSGNQDRQYSALTAQKLRRAGDVTRMESLLSDTLQGEGQAVLVTALEICVR